MSIGTKPSAFLRQHQNLKSGQDLLNHFLKDADWASAQTKAADAGFDLNNLAANRSKVFEADAFEGGSVAQAPDAKAFFLESNPQLKSNQDAINHFVGNGTFAEGQARAQNAGFDLNTLAQNRNAALRAPSVSAHTISVSSNKGAALHAQFDKPQNNANQHIVKPGEDMSAIAQQHGVSVDELIAANPKENPWVRSAGDALVIPAKSAVPFMNQTEAQGNLGHSSTTISAAGCMLASFTMASHKLNGALPQNASIEKANGAAIDNGGFSGDMMNTPQVASALNMKIASRTMADPAAIQKQLEAGNPVVIGVDYVAGKTTSGFGSGADHFLVLTDYDAATQTFKGHDPLGVKDIGFTLDESGALRGQGPKAHHTYKAVEAIVLEASAP